MPQTTGTPPRPRALTSGYASRRHICSYPDGMQTVLVLIETDADKPKLAEHYRRCRESGSTPVRGAGMRTTSRLL